MKISSVFYLFGKKMETINQMLQENVKTKEKKLQPRICARQFVFSRLTSTDMLNLYKFTSAAIKRSLNPSMRS
uniref:Uncharacterized protein n=1 Tax=Rhizophora mucronata TaxID=61149 RepID=A0A2P2Q2Z6_RHIMU